MLSTYQSSSLIKSFADYFDLEVSTTIKYAFSGDYQNNADIDELSCGHMALILDHLILGNLDIL